MRVTIRQAFILVKKKMTHFRKHFLASGALARRIGNTTALCIVAQTVVFRTEKVSDYKDYGRDLK